MPPRLLFRLFPLAAAGSRAIEQRFSSAGRLLLGLLVAGAILGVDIGETLGYELAILAFALLTTSVLCSLRWRPQVTLRRVLPPLVTAGVPAHYWIEISNHGTRAERDIILVDELGNPPLSHNDYRHLRDLTMNTRANWFDRAVGFPRWVALRRLRRGAELAPITLPVLPAGTTTRVRMPLTTLRRGRIEFVAMRLLRPDALGLFRARYTRRVSDALLALPRRHAVAAICRQSARRYQPGGISLALAVGDSQEFAALRDYRPGDPRRHIHWRSFAKVGRLVVKQYQDEYFDRHALVVDCQLPATAAATFEAVIEVAASIVGGRRPRDSILDLLIAGTTVLPLSTGRGLGDGVRALVCLAEARLSDTDDFGPLAAQVHARVRQLASLILVLGRWDDARAALVAELSRNAVPCISVLLTHASAAPPPPRRTGSHLACVVRVAAIATDLALIGSVR